MNTDKINLAIESHKLKNAAVDAVIGFTGNRRTKLFARLHAVSVEACDTARRIERSLTEDEYRVFWSAICSR